MTQRLADLALVFGRVGLGGLLILAGLLKASAPGAFATEIANYQLWPTVAPHVAATLPMIELGLGAALIAASRAWRRAAALGAALLLVGFTFAVGSVYFRGLNIDCGCFGTGGGPITFLTILRNLALLGVALALVRFQAPRTGDQA